MYELLLKVKPLFQDSASPPRQLARVTAGAVTYITQMLAESVRYLPFLLSAADRQGTLCEFT